MYLLLPQTHCRLGIAQLSTRAACCNAASPDTFPWYINPKIHIKGRYFTLHEIWFYLISIYWYWPLHRLTIDIPYSLSLTLSLCCVLLQSYETSSFMWVLVWGVSVNRKFKQPRAHVTRDTCQVAVHVRDKRWYAGQLLMSANFRMKLWEYQPSPLWIVDHYLTTTHAENFINNFKMQLTDNLISHLPSLSVG